MVWIFRQTLDAAIALAVADAINGCTYGIVYEIFSFDEDGKKFVEEYAVKHATKDDPPRAKPYKFQNPLFLVYFPYYEIEGECVSYCCPTESGEGVKIAPYPIGFNDTSFVAFGQKLAYPSQSTVSH